jgi:hypothetical protein
MPNLLNYLLSGKVLCGKTRFMKLDTLLGYLLCGFDSFLFLTLFKLAKFLSQDAYYLAASADLPGPARLWSELHGLFWLPCSPGGLYTVSSGQGGPL